MMQFIGRQKELDALQGLLSKRSASLVVIRGRRRIGKSRLAEEFSQHFPHSYTFSGIPPQGEQADPQAQKAEFIRQLRNQQIPSNGSQDWGDLFYDLASYCHNKSVLVILDEITWMGDADPQFLGKLKIAWDLYFKKIPKLVMILSGSNSAWIEKNILSQTGFYGRISLRPTLEELSLSECSKFWGTHKVSAYEKLKILSVTGGIPRYLEEINPKHSAEENIYRLCYQSDGVLFNEFNDMFADLFQRRSTQYKAIVQAIAAGKKTTAEIASALERTKGGDLSAYIDNLCLDGFVRKNYSWQFKTGKKQRLIQYQLSDNYLRFYLNYIEPYRHRIEIDEMDALPPGWDSMMGFQFENLVIHNRKQLHRLLKIPAHEIIMSGPYQQNTTKKQAGCQIDYLLQTKFNTLYLCEIKFSKNALGTEVIQQVEDKINALVLPSGFSIRPVLIHVNGINDALIARDYFAHIVDFSDFFGAA